LLKRFLLDPISGVATYRVLGHVPPRVLEILCILQLLPAYMWLWKFQKLPKKDLYYFSSLYRQKQA